MQMQSKHRPPEVIPSAQQWPQEDDDITADRSKLLNEGHIYDNEDLVSAQPNSAYMEAGQITTPIVNKTLWFTVK